MSRPELPQRLECMKISMTETSIDSSYVADKPNEKFVSGTMWLCPICLGVPRIPVMLNRCGHIGCKPCLHEYLMRRGKYSNGTEQGFWVGCPICRQAYRENSLISFQQWQLLAKLTFNNVQVRCPGTIISHDLNCEFIGSVSELVNHEAFECRRRWIKCPNSGCEVQGMEDVVKEHFKSCEWLMVFCAGCTLPVKWIDIPTHQCLAEMQSALQQMAETCRRAHVSVSRELVPGIAGHVVMRPTDPVLDTTYSEIADAYSSTPQRGSSPTSPASPRTPPAPPGSPGEQRRLVMAPRAARARIVAYNGLGQRFLAMQD
jgi:hypothetical protein